MLFYQSVETKYFWPIELLKKQTRHQIKNKPGKGRIGALLHALPPALPAEVGSLLVPTKANACGPVAPGSLHWSIKVHAYPVASLTCCGGNREKIRHIQPVYARVYIYTHTRSRVYAGKFQFALFPNPSWTTRRRPTQPAAYTRARK